MSRVVEAAPPRVLSLACLGRLGQWGNQLLQYAFARVIAEANGLALHTPPWLGALVFGLADGSAAPPDLPLVADRVVLSHAAWRKLAATREPYVSLLAAQPGAEALSGVSLRRHFPQVCGESLAAPTACAAACGGELWGWFQFHTSDWSAAQRARLLELFAPVPPLGAAFDAALARLLRGARSPEITRDHTR